MNREENPIIAPQKAHAKVYHSVPTPREDGIEFLHKDARPKSPGADAGTLPSEDSQVNQRNDVEMSRPSSPIDADGDGFSAMQSFSNPPINRFRLLSVCLLNFAGGFNDAAPGALIPYMEK
jgi:hypothetical protein